MTSPTESNVAENAALEQAERELQRMTAADLLDLQRYIRTLEESAGITGSARTSLRGPKDSIVEFSATAATPVAAYLLLQESVKEMLGKGFTLVIETDLSSTAPTTTPRAESSTAAYPHPAQAATATPAGATAPTVIGNSEFPIVFVRHEVAKNGTHIVRVKGGAMLSFGVAAYPELLERYPQFAKYMEWPINIDLPPAEKIPGITVAVIQQGEKYSKVVEFK